MYLVWGDNLKKRNDQPPQVLLTARKVLQNITKSEELAHSARFRANYIEKANFALINALL